MAFPVSSSELLSLLLLLPPAGLDFMLFAATADAFAFSVEAGALEPFCTPFTAFLGFPSSSLELSDELLLLLEAAAFFPTAAFAAPVDLVAGFPAGFSSSLLELSESDVSALGAGVEGLDSGLATLPADLAGGPFFFFFSSSELLELLSESELLCAFFVAAGDFFAAGVAALVVGFAGAAFLSELSESRMERKRAIKAKSHSFNTRLAFRFSVDTQYTSSSA